MIGTTQPFPQVTQQLRAARGSLDSLLVRLVALGLRDCLASRESQPEVDGLLPTALSRNGLRVGDARTASSAAAPSHVALEEGTRR